MASANCVYTVRKAITNAQKLEKYPWIKAKDLAELIDSENGVSIDKKELNPILYDF